MSFTGKDGSAVEGITLYITEPLDPKRGGQGESAERIFLSTAKVANLGFNLTVGQDVTLYWNRYGKVETLKLLDETIDFGGKAK